MNKIYKVIWSKAKNCYVAVSEIANAHSKGGKRARAAALSALLISAVLAPFSMPTLEAAYTASGTDEAQYTVFQATDTNPTATKTITYNSENYTYNLQTLTNPDDGTTVKVYVRDGYTAALVTGKRFSSGTAPDTSYKIMAYKTGSGTDDALLYTDSVNSTIGSTTLTNTGIKDVSVNMYTGGVVAAADTPYSWNYYIQDSTDTWVDGGSGGVSRFREASVNANGMYTYNGEILENSYVYVIKVGSTYKVGVFVDGSGNIYRGNVYGKHNEILKTAVDENNNIYSFWGAENDDPNVLIANSNMTIGEFNRAMGALVTNVRNAQGDDIAKVKATADEENGGTLSLMRRGTYNETTKTYTGDYAVEGTLKLTSKGGTDGNDVTLHIQQAGEDGTYADAFTLAAGSKVVALSGDDGTTTATDGDTLKKLQINGTTYNLAQDTDTTYTAGDHISIDTTDNNKISVTVDGSVTAGDTNIVSGGTVYNAIINTASNNDIKSGTIGADGKVTLTKNDNNTIEVGTVKDYSVTSGTYDSNGKKITLTKQNAYNVTETATVDIDLTDLETKMGDLTNITNEGEKKITNIAANAVVVAKGTNITSVGETTDANGVKTFTINAKDTTLNEATSSTDATTGAVSWTITDTDGKSVKLDDLASNTALSNLKTEVTNNTTNISKLDEGAVKYDTNDDKTVNYNSVTMGGDKYYAKGETKGDTVVTTSEGGTKITNVAYSDGTKSDAVNVEYLQDQIAASQKKLTDGGFALIGTAKDSKATKKELGGTITVGGANGIVVSSTDGDDGKVTVSLDNNITIGTKGETGTSGEQGHIGLAGKDGEDGIDGKDGNIVDIHIEKGKNGEKGEDGKDGEMGANGVDGTDGITRIVYTDAKGDHQVATMEDGLKFGGDTGDVISKKLNNQLDIKGGATGTLTDNNIGVVSADGVLNVKLAKDLTNITSITNGDVSITLNSGDTKNITITGGDLNVNNNKITNVADGTADTDAVNKGQLDKAIEASKSDLTSKGFALEDEDGNKVEKKLGEAIKVVGENGINVNASNADGKVTVSLDNNITIGKDGKDGAQGHIGLAGKDGENIKIIDIRAEKGAAGVDGKDGEDGITRIIYKDGDVDHQVATLDDGLLFGGDSGDTIAKKLNEKLEIKGGADKDNLTENNIGVISDAGVLKVKLANALSGITSITNGDTSITLNNGVTINGGDLNVNNNKITNVANGTDSTDAVNKGQLDDLDKFVVKYDKDKADETKPNYNSVTLGGSTYDGTNKTGGTTITNVSYATVTDKTATDYDGSQAVNMDRLNDSIADAIKDSTDAATSKGFALIGSTEGSTKVQKNLGEAITVAGENGINVSSDGEKVLVSLGKDITIGTKGEDGDGGKKGEAGSIGLAGEDGTNGKDGNVIEITVKNGENKDGTDGKDGEKGAAGVDGTDGITRIVYTDAKGDHQVATMEDGLKFGGDTGAVISKKLNNQLDIKGGVTDTTKLTDNNIGVVSDGSILNVKLAKDLTNITSITNDKVSITLNSGDTNNITIKGGDLNVSKNKITNVADGTDSTDAVNKGQLDKVKDNVSDLSAGAVKYDKNGNAYNYNSVTLGGDTYYAKGATKDGTVVTTSEGGTKITNVAYSDGTKSDAVNVEYLQDQIAASQKKLTDGGFALIGTAEGSEATKKELGGTITVDGANGIVVSSTDGDDGKVTVSLDNNITIGTKGEEGKQGEAGSIGLAGEDGTNGKDGNVIEITVKNGENKDGTDGKDGEKGAAGVDGEDGITRIVYQDKQGEHQVATMEDGLKFGGDTGDVISKKLNNQLDIKGGVTDTTKLTDGNIGVVSADGVLNVKLAKDLTNITSITNGNVSITLNSGDTNNITINGGDLNVNNNKITNVKDGENDGDAVNMGQLKEVKEEISTLGKGAVMYDTDEDGNVDYTKVTMGGKEGTTYSRKEEKDDDDNVTVTYTGGTTITNVSYAEVSKRGADGYDGSQAVNMDRLNDSIADAMSQVKTDVAGTEKHIKAGTYEIKDGKVTMHLVDGNETETGETVVINNVAKASDIGSLNGGHTTDGDGKLKDDLRNTEKNEDGSDKTDESGNIIYKDTTVVDAINKVDDKVEAVSQEFNSYKSETDTKIEKINTSIKTLTDDVNRRSTTVTVNGNKDGNLKLDTTKEDDGKKVTFDISLSDKVTLGEGDKAVTLDGTTGEASISKKLTVGSEKDGVTITKTDLGTYTADVKDQDGTEHKKGDTMSGYSAGGLANTTIHYDKFANGSGKAATEEQMKEALGDMDFDATIKNQAGETVNKYNIVNTATNVTEAVYQLDQNLTQANARIDNNTTNIQKLSGSLGKLNTRVNRVGAGAAALAALHPLDFDPDDKWDFAAGYGNYAGANATAIGAYYRPNEDTMLSVAGSFGGGENMVNAGVSFKLGRGNHVTTSKVAMAKEIKSLRATVEEQGKQIAALTALVEKLTGETVATPESPAPAETFTVDIVEEKDGQPVIERVRTAKGA